MFNALAIEGANRWCCIKPRDVFIDGGVGWGDIVDPLPPRPTPPPHQPKTSVNFVAPVARHLGGRGVDGCAPGGEGNLQQQCRGERGLRPGLHAQLQGD